jgi:hypothetical protein
VSQSNSKFYQFRGNALGLRSNYPACPDALQVRLLRIDRG